MKISENWKDYSIIATGDGYKLERWKDVYLLRPDPQVIWSSQFDLFSYPKLNAYYKRSEKGGGGWKNLKPMPEEWNISYDELDISFKIKPMGFKHTGLFPEQAVNWEKMTQLIKNAGRPIKVLNLFGGIKISDAQCGFKAFVGEKGRRIFSLCKTNNFAFDLEVILIAQKMKLKIYELPAKIINHRESKVNVIKDAFKMMKEIAKIKKNISKMDF